MMMLRQTTIDGSIRRLFFSSALTLEANNAAGNLPAVLPFVAAVSALFGMVVTASAAPPTTEKVNVSPSGAEADLPSEEPAISADGRWVAFTSSATNLVPGDPTEPGMVISKVFVRDRLKHITELVSATFSGQVGWGSHAPSISADGRYVAFHSLESIVPEKTRFGWDVYVRDRVTGKTEWVSVAADGTEANSDSNLPSISADGRYVAFSSGATNLVPGDTNGYDDVFVRDRLTHRTTLVSVASSGAQANGSSAYPFIGAPSISADGRYVAFISYASNLVAGDTNNFADVFVRDRVAKKTERVSVAFNGAQANAPLIESTPSISADGRYVAFSSLARNLVPGDTTNTSDVFVRDRATKTTERVSVASSGAQGNDHSFQPSLSANGRFVAFSSAASNLVAGDTNGFPDVFVRDRVTKKTERVSSASDGAQGDRSSFDPSINANGRYVGFYSDADLVPGLPNEYGDIYVRDRGRGQPALPDRP